MLHTVRSTFSQGGLTSLLVPHGAAMVAAREAPYAGCLFFLSGWIRSRVKEVTMPRAGGTPAK